MKTKTKLFTLVAAIAMSVPSNAQVFTNVISTSGLPMNSNAKLHSVFDYDNDGLMDLVYSWGTPRIYGLWKNNGDLTFTNASASANFNYDYGGAVVAADIDNDGWEDLVYVDGGVSHSHVFIQHNIGGVFQVDTIELSGSDHYNVYLVDIDQDSFLDLLVNRRPSGQSRTIRVYYNPGADSLLTATWAYEDLITIPASILPAVDFFDHDNDGDQDIFLHWAPTNQQSPGNGYYYWPIKVYENDQGVFTDVTATTGLGLGNGAATKFDFNNDGFVDLLYGTADCCVNPEVARPYRNNGNGTFTDLSSSIDLTNGSHYFFEATTADIENDGDMDVYWKQGAWTTSQLYINNGGSSFSGNQASVYGLALSGGNDNNGAPGGIFPDWFDLDNDGDLDVICTSRWSTGLPFLMVNPANDQSTTNYLQIDLVGCASGLTALNSTVLLYTSGNVLAQTNSTKKLGGNLCGRFHFGLGASSQADSVVVHWSSGASSTIYNIAGDQIIKLFEDSNCTQWNQAPCDNWTQVPDFGGGPRRAAFAVTLNGKAYIGGGQTDGTTYLQDFWEYNPISGVSTQLADFGGGPRARGVAFTSNDKIYWGLGNDENFVYSDDLWEYNPSDDSWTQQNDFPGGLRNYPSTFTIHDTVYVGLGYNGSTHKKDLWKYDPLTDTWAQRADYGGIPLTVASSFVLEGKAYVGVGEGNSPNIGYYNTFWEYDPLADSWAQKADLPGPVRAAAVAFSINGYGYLGTGGTSYPPNDRSKDFYRYDPTMDSWEQISDFGGIERNVASVFKVNGKVYVGCGGEAGPTAFADIWEFCGVDTSEPIEDEIKLDLSVILEGPYDPNLGLMHDSLRSQSLIPLGEPFTALGYFHIGNGGMEVIAPSVLDQTGPAAIVDWVLVELRDALFNGFRIESRSALLRRDGKVVATDGVSPLVFDVLTDDYFVAVKHRNHLGVLTALPVNLQFGTTFIDFSDPSTPTFGTEAQKLINGKHVLWSGDALWNGQLKYAGSSNDRDRVLVRIGGTVPTNVAVGYFTEDVNMDGEVKYTGSNNDRDVILQNIGGTVPTNVRNGQVP